MFEQDDSLRIENGRWFFMSLSTNFTAKYNLVFVLTQENANS